MRYSERDEYEDAQRHFLPVGGWSLYTYIAAVLSALVVTLFTVIDIIDSSKDDQFLAKDLIFPRSVYIALLTSFFGLSFVHCMVKWFLTYDPAEEKLSVAATNLNWTLVVFYFSCLMIFLYVVVARREMIFLFSSVFAFRILLTITFFFANGMNTKR